MFMLKGLSVESSAFSSVQDVIGRTIYCKQCKLILVEQTHTYRAEEEAGERNLSAQSHRPGDHLASQVIKERYAFPTQVESSC